MSSMAAFARPVRSDLNSRCSASMAPCMRCCTSLMTSLIMSLPLLVADDGTDILADEGSFDISLLPKRKNVDRNRAAAREVDGRRIHHFQPLGEHALIRRMRDSGGGRILLRIG